MFPCLSYSHSFVMLLIGFLIENHRISHLNDMRYCLQEVNEHKVGIQLKSIFLSSFVYMFGTIINVQSLNCSLHIGELSFRFSSVNLILKQDAREAMRVVFSVLAKRICMHAQNEVSYEYIQILF